jgi:hypothetical protein
VPGGSAVKASTFLQARTTAGLTSRMRAHSTTDIVSVLSSAAESTARKWASSSSGAVPHIFSKASAAASTEAAEDRERGVNTVSRFSVVIAITVLREVANALGSLQEAMGECCRRGVGR